ncbi:matrixin family metalloprotease, partial [Arthrobacter agilis]|uniref:matrixin family metalloprotease n=1 Tax=Arthrobacter agilis TaxID=37921 RepID=UPI001ABF84E1
VSPVRLIFEALLPVLPQVTSIIGQLAVIAGQLASVIVSGLTIALKVLAPVITGLLMGLAGFISGITSSEAGVTGLMTVLSAAAAVWLLFQGRILATTIATNAHILVTKAQAVAAKAAAAGQWLMNAALTANPIGIVVAAVAALVGGLVYFFSQTDTGRKIIQNVWGAIKSFIGGVADWFRTTFLPGLQMVFKAVGVIFSWLYNDIIKPVWNGIRDTISGVWNNKIKPVFNALKTGVEALPAAFEAAKNGIGSAWDAIREAVKEPIRAGIGFINEGLIDRFNTIPGVNIKKLALPPGFQKGGYTGDGAASEFAGHVHKGEYVFTKAQTSAIGKDRLASLAHGAASGRLADGSSALFFGGLQQSFKDAGAAYVRSVGAGSWNIPGAASLWDGAAGLKVRAGNGSPSMTATLRPLGNQILGYAYSNGDISLASGWVNQLSPTQRRTTAAHEIGHVLGLPHNSGMRSIMHPNLASQSPVPTGTDIRNLQALYPGGTGRAGAGNENPFDGLVDALAGKLKAAFPGGGMFIDAAAGLAKTGIEQVVKIVTDIKNGIKEIAGNVFGKVKEFFGGGASTAPTLYDNGGVLSPNGGRPQLVQNKTGKPEYIFTNREMQALANGGGPAVVNNYNGPVGFNPEQLARHQETNRRRAQTMAGLDGVVFA